MAWREDGPGLAPQALTLEYQTVLDHISGRLNSPPEDRGELYQVAFKSTQMVGWPRASPGPSYPV
jgi:hypothetical protein